MSKFKAGQKFYKNQNADILEILWVGWFIVNYKITYNDGIVIHTGETESMLLDLIDEDKWILMESTNMSDWLDLL